LADLQQSQAETEEFTKSFRKVEGEVSRLDRDIEKRMIENELLSMIQKEMVVKARTIRVSLPRTFRPDQFK
jgi:hypothetical protein